MALNPPGWCKGAVPTPQGWRDPNTNELLKSQAISQADIDEWNGVPTITETKEVLIEAMPEPVDDEEEEWEEYDLHSMSKIELEALGREYGIELDRREKKDALIEQLEAVMYEDEE